MSDTKIMSAIFDFMVSRTQCDYLKKYSKISFKVDIKFTERSFFYSSYPNFKRSIYSREHFMWCHFQASYQSPKSYSTNSSSDCHSLRPNSAILLTGISTAFQNILLGGKCRMKTCRKVLPRTEGTDVSGLSIWGGSGPFSAPFTPAGVPPFWSARESLVARKPCPSSSC